MHTLWNSDEANCFAAAVFPWERVANSRERAPPRLYYYFYWARRCILRQPRDRIKTPIKRLTDGLLKMQTHTRKIDSQTLETSICLERSDILFGFTWEELRLVGMLQKHRQQKMAHRMSKSDFPMTVNPLLDRFKLCCHIIYLKISSRKWSEWSSLLFTSMSRHVFTILHERAKTFCTFRKYFLKRSQAM